MERMAFLCIKCFILSVIFQSIACFIMCKILTFQKVIQWYSSYDSDPYIVLLIIHSYTDFLESLGHPCGRFQSPANAHPYDISRQLLDDQSNKF